MCEPFVRRFIFSRKNIYHPGSGGAIRRTSKIFPKNPFSTSRLPTTTRRADETYTAELAPFMRHFIVSELFAERLNNTFFKGNRCYHIKLTWSVKWSKF